MLLYILQMAHKLNFNDVITGKSTDRIFYEDKETIAFLDHNPVTKGHSLVIPRKIVDHLDECDSDLYQAIFKTVHKISKILKSKLHPERIVLVVHGYDVPHAHVHVIPVYAKGDVRFGKRPERVVSSSELIEVKTILTEKHNENA